MSPIEIWSKVALPIVQFLIGPIVTGGVIYHLTNKSSKKKEKDSITRQLNLLKSKVERIIMLVGNLNKELNNNEKYSDRIREMNQGDFSEVVEELDYIGNQQDCISHYQNLKASSGKTLLGLNKEIKETALSLTGLSMDSIPTNIHGDLQDIIESKQIELDLIKINTLLKKIKKYL